MTHPVPPAAPLWRPALLSSLVMLAITLPPAAMAEETTPAPAATPAITRFDIPPGPLGAALTRFSEIAGFKLLAPAELLRGLRTAGVQNAVTREQGLGQLLAGTGLLWHYSDDGTVILEPAPRVEGALVLDAVQVIGTVPDADLPYLTPGSSLHISRDKIERFRGTTVGDIFKGATGVLVGENRNSGGLDVNIRGMQGQGRVPVLVDGSRQETTVYRGYSGVASRSYVDPDLIGGIDITKGPSMSAQGTGAIGGMVNMRTLGARDIVKDGNDSGWRLRGSAVGNTSSAPPAPAFAGYYVPRSSYRSNCRFASDCSPETMEPASFAPADGMDRPGLLDFEGWAGSLAGARRFENFELVAAYAQRQQGSYYAGTHGPAPYIEHGEPLVLPWWTETPVYLRGVSRFRAGERVPNSRYESKSLLLKSAFYLPAEQALELSYLRYDSVFGEMMPSQIRGFGQAREWSPSRIVMDTYTAQYKNAPTGSNWLDLRANLWHTDSHNIINTPDPQTGSGNNYGLEANTRRDEDYRRYGADVSNSSRFSAPGGEIKLTYGLAGQWEDMMTATDNPGGFYGDQRSGNRREYSAFANLQWQLPWYFTFEAGTRYTRFESADDNALPVSPASEFCVDTDNDLECDPIYYKNHHAGRAPMVGLTWAPWNGWQFFARYSEALRMPSLFETTSGLSVSPVMDVGIKPERAKNREAGFNYLKDGLLTEHDKFRLKFAFFQNHVDDYLTRTQPNGWEDGALYSFFRMRNIKSLDLHGTELSGSYDTGRFYTEFGGTRYHHIEVCNIGSFVRYYCTNYGIAQSYLNNMIPPNWHANLTLGTRLFRERLDTGVRGTFMGKRNNIPRYNAQTGFNAPIAWHKYTLYDVYASWKQNEHLSFDITVDNLTDQYYLDALSLGLVPAPGRSARLSFTLEF